MPLFITAVLAAAQTVSNAANATPDAASGVAAISATADARTEIVTVRGQRESVARAPASVVSVAPQNIISVDAIADAVPGVWMINDQDPGTNILSIRGATTDRLQQASVAVVMDGVPLADTELFTPRLFDVADIDVLKGPQGALYGKNAAGGVIALNSQRGTEDYLQFSGGNGGLVEASGALGVALSPQWTLRLSGLVSDAEGWITNTTLNRKVDATATQAARGLLTGDLGGWNLLIKAQWLEEDGGAAWASSNNVTGQTKGRLSGKVLINPIGDYPGQSWRRWGHGLIRAQRPTAAGQLSLYVARDSYAKRWDEELDYRPGPLTFFGFPAFPNGIQPISQPIDVRATTAEMRWVSDHDASPVRYQYGIFAQETDKDRVDDFGPLLFGGPAPVYLTRSRQISAFGAVAGAVSARVGWEVQGRFDSDTRSQSILSRVGGPVVDRRTADFERLQPRATLQYLHGNTNLYVTYGEAFRPGGFNPAPLAQSIWKATYRPEITSSFEAGWKQGFAQGRGRLTLAAFSNQVQDYQNYTFIDNQSVTLNVNDVAVKGVEADLMLTLTPWLRAGGTWSQTEADIRRFIATDPLLGSPAVRDYSGKAVPNTPRSAGKLWADLHNQNGAYRWQIRLDLNAVGTTYYEIDNVLYSPARWSGDLSAFVARGDWSLRLVIANVTDETWAISAFGQGMTGLLAGLGPNGPFDTFTRNRGRRITATLRKEF